MNRPALAQTVTADEAAVLRRVVAMDGIDNRDPRGAGTRLWQPIEVAEATGKARCRYCSETIPKGERCIRFGFDPYSGEGSWGRLSAVYLHLAPCEGGTTT